MAEEAGCPLVVDSGIRLTKAGFGGDDTPARLVPTVVGAPRDFHKFMPSSRPNLKKLYCGDDAMSRRGILNLSWGETFNWDQKEEFLQHIYSDQLRTAPEEHPILFSCHTQQSAADRERITQIHFESFGTPGFLLVDDAVLSLYAHGRTNGLVLDLGGTGCRAVPIFESQVLTPHIQNNELSGDCLTTTLIGFLTEKGYAFHSAYERAIIAEIKKEICYVAADPLQERLRALSSDDLRVSHDVGENRSIDFEIERFLCPESLFDPSSYAKPSLPSCRGIHQLIADAISSCPADLRLLLGQNIVLSGGGSVIPGLDTRLTNELKIYTPPSSCLTFGSLSQDLSADKSNLFSRLPHEVRVHCDGYAWHPTKTNILPDKGRKDVATWLGGSILTTAPHFDKLLLTNQQYQEIGPTAIHHYQKQLTRVDKVGNLFQ